MNNLSIETATQFTAQYCHVLYGDEAGDYLFNRYRDHLFDYHGLAWTLGKKSFRYFCSVFLYGLLFDVNNGCVPLSKSHYKIWDEMQDTILNRNNTRHVYVFPRSFGKTTTCSTSISLWCALYGIHPYVMIDSATDKQATAILAVIKQQLEDNSYIDSCFGKVINKNLKYNENEIELDIKPSRSKIQAISSTGGARGFIYSSGGRVHRIGLLVLDDSQEDKLVRTPDGRAALVNKIENGLLMGLQNDNNHVLAFGTPQFKDDVYGTYINSIGWIAKTEKCIQLDDIDEYFRTSEGWQKIREILRNKNTNPNATFDAETYYNQHKDELKFPIIWENYNRFDLAVEYFKNPVAFKQERQCDINCLGEKRIKSLSAIPAKDIESLEFTNTILSVDPASTANKKSDYSAFCVLSDTENHIKYARKCIIDRLEFNDYIKMILSLLVKYPDINTISIEKQTYSGADVIKLREQIQRIPELMCRPITYINKARTKNKDSRIDTVIPDINMGRIVFNEDDIDAINQIKEFAGTAYTEHDDMIDCVADAAENIVNIEEAIPKLQVFSLADFGF